MTAAVETEDEYALPEEPRGGGSGRLAARPVALALAVIAFLVCGGIGALVARSGGTTYGSNEVLTIDQPLAVAAARDAGPIDKLGRLRLQYAALVNTAVIADDIATRTGRTAGDVSSALEVKPSLNSLLMVLTARDAKKPRAVDLAKAAGDALITYAHESQVKAKVPPAQQVELSVVTPATPAYGIARSTRTVATVALFAGLLGAAAVYVAVSLLTALRSR